MNKKGFTIAELLGVIVILGIIAVIAISTVDTKIKEGRYTTCMTQAKNIEEAAKAWAIDHPYDDSITMSVSELQSLGYLDDDFINPMTDKDYELGSIVEVEYNEENKKYTVEFHPTENDTCR